MSRYIKSIEVYRLGDEEMPKWLQNAIKKEVIIFEKKRHDRYGKHEST